jgi:hypothetical protein
MDENRNRNWLVMTLVLIVALFGLQALVARTGRD